MTRPQRHVPPAVVDLRAVQCVGYLRVSTDGQATDDKTSLADQARAIESAAKRRGLEIGHWFRDAGASGATVDGRPQFRALLASCEAHPRTGARGVVLSLNDSRWGRFPDPNESGYWQFHLSRLGWDVRFAEGDDVDDVMARGVMRFIGAAQASEYRLALQRNVRRGVRGSAELGFWTRGEAPFGFRRRVVVPVGRERTLELGQHKAEDERVALVPHEPEAVVVRALFERYAAGICSLLSLATWADAEFPGNDLSRRTVQRILGNRVYLGAVLSGPVTAKRGEEYGKHDAHEALVSPDLFDRVQVQLRANFKKPQKPASDYLVSGLVACTVCGHTYNGGGYGSKRADGSRCRFYRCGSHSFDRLHAGCPGPLGTISKHFLEDAVIGTIAAELAKPSTQSRIAAAVDRYLASTVTDTGQARESARRELARLEKRRDNLVAAVADGTLQRQEVADQLVTIRAQIEQATAAVQRLAFRRRQDAAATSERDQLLALASHFGEAVKTVAPSEVRALVRPWLASATFDKRTRQLTLAIRRVPAIPNLLPTPRLGRKGRKQDVVVRRMVIGGRW